MDTINTDQQACPREDLVNAYNSLHERRDQVAAGPQTAEQHEVAVNMGIIVAAMSQAGCRACLKDGCQVRRVQDAKLAT